jgi:hypothetical protein
MIAERAMEDHENSANAPKRILSPRARRRTSNPQPKIVCKIRSQRSEIRDQKTIRNSQSAIRSGTSAVHRIFLLSPANCSGDRAQMVLNEKAAFDVAVRLRSAEGATLGEVFSFLSGLYFRGKLAYARLFACPPSGLPGVLVITPNAGLRPEDVTIRQKELRAFARVPIHKTNQLYRRPFTRDARKLAADIGPDCEVVLLGSIASAKYTDILNDTLGNQVRVPAEFIGRGDMSRGGLLLRCVREERELEYIPVPVVLSHGSAPARFNMTS